MQIIELPESLKLVDGRDVKLAPLALNKKFVQFVSVSSEGKAADAMEALVDCLGDCIKNGNPDMKPEEAVAAAQLIPLNFVVGLLNDAQAKQ